MGIKIAQLELPKQLLVVAIKRGEQIIIPRGDKEIEVNDTLIFGAEPFREQEEIHLTEIILREEHPWNNLKIKDLDISRHSIIVLVKRKNKVRIPYGDMILKEWDHVFMYTQKFVVDAKEIEI